MKKRRGRKRKLKPAVMADLMERCRKENAAWSRLFDSPDDAAQEYGLRLLEGKHQRATVKQALVDMVRDRVGRTTAPGFEARMNLGHALPVDVAKLNPITRPFEQVDRILLLEQLILKLKPREQKIMVMYLEGYTLGEIAKDYGCTQAYIHHLWQAATVSMRKAARA